VRKYILIITGIAIAFVAGVIGFWIQQDLSPKQAGVKNIIAPNKSAGVSVIGLVRPDFSLADIDGQLRNAREWDDQILVINFWATWCPPCREEIPGFIKLQDKYADQGLQFVGIALQTASEVQDFIQEFGMNYPVLVGAADVIEVAVKYGNSIGALPYTVIIGRDQRIQFTRQGPLSTEEAEIAIRSVL